MSLKHWGIRKHAKNDAQRGTDILSNLCGRPPPNEDYPVYKGHISVTLAWLNKTILPPNKGHLSIKTGCGLLPWVVFIHRFDCICMRENNVQFEAVCKWTILYILYG